MEKKRLVAYAEKKKRKKNKEYKGRNQKLERSYVHSVRKDIVLLSLFRLPCYLFSSTRLSLINFIDTSSLSL